jgi:hypothetical protein
VSGALSLEETDLFLRQQSEVNIGPPKAPLSIHVFVGEHFKTSSAPLRKNNKNVNMF